MLKIFKNFMFLFASTVTFQFIFAENITQAITNNDNQVINFDNKKFHDDQISPDDLLQKKLSEIAFDNPENFKTWAVAFNGMYLSLKIIGLPFHLKNTQKLPTYENLNNEEKLIWLNNFVNEYNNLWKSFKELPETKNLEIDENYFPIDIILFNNEELWDYAYELAEEYKKDFGNFGKELNLEEIKILDKYDESSIHELYSFIMDIFSKFNKLRRVVNNNNDSINKNLVALHCIETSVFSEFVFAKYQEHLQNRSKK